MTEESCMKKVVLATFLACAALVSGLPFASAQDASSGTQAAPAGAQAPPAGAQAPPAGTQAPPAGTQAAPAGAQAPPAGTQAAPAGAQAPPAGTQAAPAAAANSCAAPQMAAAEYAVYNNAQTQTDPKAQAAGLEQYLTQFPQSAVQENTLERIMALNISLNDAAKALDAADRLLKVNPNSIKALYVEALIRKSQADAITDATAKQAALDSAASYADR